MPPILYNIHKHIAQLYTATNILWQIFAVILTYCIVAFGLDWQYYSYWHDTQAYHFFFPGAAILGFVIPIIVPFTILLIGSIQNKPTLKNTAWALGQAAIIGVLVSSFYKVFTGRPGPEIANAALIHDISHVFRFGIYRGGAFWGWPSSHTTVAVAMAVTSLILYPKYKTVAIITIIYTLYIAIGASMSFHWLSDVIAGTILGTLIGYSVANGFKNQIKTNT